MEYVKRLNESIEALENSANGLSKISEMLSLIDTITNDMQTEKDELQKMRKQLETIKLQAENEAKATIELAERISNTSMQIVDKNDRIFDDGISAIKEELEKYGEKNQTSLDNTSTHIINKLTLIDNDIQASISSRLSTIENSISRVISDRKEANEKLIALIEEERTDIKKVNSEVLKIKTMTLIAIAASTIGIIVSILI